jgi:predicted lipoprotein with Yx(FWY)xxD motif
MKLTLRRAGGRVWAARAVAAAVLLSGSTVAAAGIAAQSPAQAQVRPAATSVAAKVVNAAFRPGFKKILVTVSGGMALYTHPGGACTASCQSIWPPLVMPTGKTKPTGASCLATVKLGKNLQVTYNGQALYTFTGDTGHSVNGNGVGGFVVAKVTTTCP